MGSIKELLITAADKRNSEIMEVTWYDCFIWAQEQTIEYLLDYISEKEVWWPKDGDTYWCINSNGCVMKNTHFASDSSIDESRLELGNCFKSRAAAEFVRDKLIILKRLGDLSDEYHNWDEDIEHWTIVFNCFTNKVEPKRIEKVILAQAFFKTEKDALNAIAEIGQEKLQKYYFNINVPEFEDDIISLNK